MVRGIFRRMDLRASAWLAAVRSTQHARTLGASGEGSWLSPTAVVRGHTRNVELGRRVSVSDHVTMDCDTEGSRIRVGDGTTILPYAMLLTHGGSISLGEQCSVNPYCMLYGHGGLQIGNFVRIATHVIIIPANHRFDDPSVPITKQGLSKRGIVIEDDVWIGAGAIILDGVRVRRGTVIAAGAVVHDDCGPLEVVGGVPAKVIKRRA